MIFSARAACTLLFVTACATPSRVVAPSADDLTAPIHCDHCDEWNAPQTPFRVFGNTYWVGPQGLGAVLITSEQGHVLLDGGLPQSAPGIEERIRALGFRVEDVKLIGISHVHFDHVGGIAALQRDSGAKVVALASAAKALEAGGPDAEDPQPSTARFPPIAHVKRIEDGQVLRVGPLAVMAHASPGHTPGGTSWSWHSCEGVRCVDVVYAESLTAISDEGYRYTDHPALVEGFRRTLDMIAALPCDALLTTHPSASGLAEKRAAQERGHADAFTTPGACRALAERARKGLDERLAREAGATVR